VRPVFQTGLTAVERKQTRLYDSTVFFFNITWCLLRSGKNIMRLVNNLRIGFLLSTDAEHMQALVMTITDNARLLCSTLCFMYR